MIDQLARQQAVGSWQRRTNRRGILRVNHSAGVGFVHCYSPLRLSDRRRSAAQLAADSSAVVMHCGADQPQLLDQNVY